MWPQVLQQVHTEFDRLIKGHCHDFQFDRMPGNQLWSLKQDLRPDQGSDWNPGQPDQCGEQHLPQVTELELELPLCHTLFITAQSTDRN